METNKICKYCKLKLQMCISEGLNCIVCSESIHLKCLEKGTVPGELNGDVFYTFTCKECSPTNEEVFLRDKLSWLQVIVLTLYNLRTKNIYFSKRGYFHWKNHIACFIEDHWDILFNKCAKKKLKLMQAVPDTLSRFDTVFFQSGEKVLAEPTLWTLKYPKLTPSAVWSLHSIFCEEKQKPKPERTSMTNTELFESILQENIQDKSFLVAIDDDHLTDEDSSVTAQESLIISERQRESTETVSSSPNLLKSCSIEGDSFGGSSTSYKPLSDPASASQVVTISKRKRRNTGMMSLSPSKLFKSCSNKDNLLGDASASYKPLFDSAVASKLLKSSSNEDDLLGCPTNDESGPSPLTSDNSSDSSSTHASNPSSPHAATPLLPHAATPSLSHAANPSLPPPKSTTIEFLDPLYYFNTCMSSVSKARHIELKTKLMGGYRRGLIKSPYSGIFLKPYIWRDIETFPPWLQLMCQVQLKSNQHIKDYVVPPRASIDYAYVQPEHIPAVNSLCNRFFWLGIDLTESLRYPEFSCVVLYKRLIVAFAFIVPNVSHTEHYLSYIFTRPGWRRIGIAKRMLYFLIKNSAGKDVTLHVSLNNVAYSMYHKFGFKAERIERNFYEKYIRTLRESKDALFCRRERSHSGDI